MDLVSGGVAPGQGKKQRRLPPGKEVGHMTPSSSIQSLLTAASLLDEDGGERGEGEWHQLWDSDRRYVCHVGGDIVGCVQGFI